MTRRLQIPPQLGQVGVGVVVGRDDHVGQGHGFVVLVPNRNLHLSVWIEVGQLAGCAHGGQFLGQPVGQEGRHGHEVGVDGQAAALVGGVAHADALVAGALAVDAQGHVAGLLLEHDQHGAAVVVEAGGRDRCSPRSRMVSRTMPVMST